MADFTKAGPSGCQQRNDRRHLSVDEATRLLDQLANGGVSDYEDEDSDEDLDPTFLPQPNENEDFNAETDVESEEEVIIPQKKSTKRAKKNFGWRKRHFHLPDTSWLDELREPEFEDIPSPFSLFSTYYDNEFFELVASCTNTYSIQVSGDSINTSLSEIKRVFASHIVMGTLGFPQYRMYWQASTRIPIIADSITVNRFSKVRQNLHVVNNITDENSQNDKLWKVRPVIDRFEKQCSTLTLENELCIDEQIIPFKGHLSIKQYIKGKPNPWGIKNFLLCGKSGIVYRILVYEGKTTRIDAALQDKFGLGASVVLTLADRIPKGKNFKLYFDNYFTSIELLEQLREISILAAGTVRKNRLGPLPLLKESEMKRNGRGFCEEIVSASKNIVVVSWYDNKVVLTASNYVGIGNKDMARRWDKVSKQYLEIERPEIIQHYNSSMGGVDKMDFLMSLYRIFITSKKWTLRVIFHMIDLAICNSWLQYKIIAKQKKIPKRKIKTLLTFRMEVAEALCLSGQTTRSVKRGRSSNGIENNPKNTSSKKPCIDVRYDLVGHFPMMIAEISQRCKMENCKGKTKMSCKKCKVYLCLTKERNCFENFHVNPKL